MTDSANLSEIYQLHFMPRGISPPVWRTILIRGHSTIADHHCILQITFNWTDSHLHWFVIRGKEYGIGRSVCTTCRNDASEIYLANFHFRLSGTFRYEYDFRDLWRHQIRLEAVRPLQTENLYPVCIAGAGASPPEDCGGPWLAWN